MKIASIHARQLVDCKGRPMVEAEVTTEDGAVGRGAAPTGITVGRHESFVLRDNVPTEYQGLGVHAAVDNVHAEIAPALVGMDVDDQVALDGRMIQLDGTPDKSRLGGNAIYATSVACYRAAAACAGVPLYRHIAGGRVATIPIPSFNMVNGGRLPGLVQPFNEFIAMPYGAESVEHAVEIGILMFAEVGRRIERFLGYPAHIARSYGYEAPSEDPSVVLSLMQDAADALGYTSEVAFALDCASSEMYDADSRTYELLGERVDSATLIAYVADLTRAFDLVFVEDILDEDDWAGYSHAVEKLPRTIVLGDDLIATSRSRVERAVKARAVDGFILKPNQVGTISEALETYAFARASGLIAVPSGRSGGVVQDVVMDLSAGLQVPFQKNGAPRSGERIEKLNFLLRVADADTGSRLADISGIIRF